MADEHSREGQRYATQAVLRYVEELHAPHDFALNAAFQAPAREALPAIQVGPSEGKLLGMLIALTGARRVVEVGALAGYSAIHLGRALPADGKLWSIESDPKHAAVTRASLAQAGLGERVSVVEGKALDVLPTIEHHAPFDAVFLDADKGHYDRYGQWAARWLRPGGLLLADNAYLFGRLLDTSADAAAMRRFHEQAAQHFQTVCIPTPDGLLLGIRRD